VFLVSVPFGVFGTAWSYWKLKELATIREGQRIDVWGNITFGVGLTVFLIAITYGLLPYGTSTMGWGNPWVIWGLISSVALLVAFPFVETRVQEPMFQLHLFKRRAFAAGNFAAFLASISRGGVSLLLIILLQAIWLPLHGINYQDTPLWAGIYMLPFTGGFVVMGPLSGYLSDKYGARGFSTAGMLITAVGYYLLSTFAYNFAYLSFAAVIFLMGIGMGMFASPNTASVMNSVPPEHRGSASGMRSTLQNTGSVVGLSMLLTLVLLALSTDLPSSLAAAASQAGAPELSSALSQIPPTTAIFAAFLGYNPMGTVLSQLPPKLTNSLDPQAVAVLTGKVWFPTAIANAFMTSLGVALYFNVALAVVAAGASVLRGKKYVYGMEDEKLEIATPLTRTSKGADPLHNSTVAQNCSGQTENRGKAQKSSD
jgi:MFS family permease